MARKKKEFSVENSMSEIELLIKKMESDQLTLQESLDAFEQGISLTKQCHQALREAQQKVTQLIEKDKKLIETPFVIDSKE